MKHLLTGEVAGGARGITRRDTHQDHPMYQPNDNALDRQKELKDLMREIARQLAPFAIDKKAKQACWDVQRGRYDFTVLSILADCAANSPTPFLLGNGIDAAVMQRITEAPSLCPIDTYLTETRAQSAADVAQALFLVERTPVRRDQALDALGVHKYALRLHKDALLRWPR